MLPLFGQRKYRTEIGVILESLQNTALMIATGCHLMSNMNHIHTETNTLPTKVHNTMLKQDIVFESQHIITR